MVLAYEEWLPLLMRQELFYAIFKKSLCLPIHQIQEIHAYSTSHFMALDRMTQRNLELTSSLQDGRRKNTLLDVLDQTQTPMGARLMHQWVKQPLLSIT